MQGTWVRSLVKELRSHRLEQLSLWAATTEPASLGQLAICAISHTAPRRAQRVHWDSWNAFYGQWSPRTPILKMDSGMSWDPPSDSPLGCILKNWKKNLTLKILKRVTSFCNKTWSQYKWMNLEKWLPNGPLNYNTSLQFDLFCCSLCSNLYGTQSGSRSKRLMPHVSFCCCPIPSFPSVSPSTRCPGPGLFPIFKSLEKTLLKF